MVVLFPAPLGPRRQKSWFSSMVSHDPLMAQKASGLLVLAQQKQQSGPIEPQGMEGKTFLRPNISTAFRCPTLAASSPARPVLWLSSARTLDSSSATSSSRDPRAS